MKPFWREVYAKRQFSSHYVPRLVLRKFSNRLCTYNIKTGELCENIAPEHAFAQNALYDHNTERALNTKVESQFGNLLANILLKADHTVSLNRMQLLQVKKFLLVSELRTMQNEEWLKTERQMKNSFAPDFKERRVEGETPYEYWMRTVNTVLDSDGTPASILQIPIKPIRHTVGQALLTADILPSGMRRKAGINLSLPISV